MNGRVRWIQITPPFRRSKSRPKRRWFGNCAPGAIRRRSAQLPPSRLLEVPLTLHGGGDAPDPTDWKNNLYHVGHRLFQSGTDFHENYPPRTWVAPLERH